MIYNIAGKNIRIKLPVGGAVTPIETEPLNQNSVGTHKLYVYSDAMTGVDVMMFAFFAKEDFNTGELFMQPISSDKENLNLWQLAIPATVLKERGTWTLAVEIRQEVSYIVVTEGASETKTGYKRLAHGNINFTVQQSVVQDSIYPEQEVYTPEQNSQYEDVIIILNEQSLTLNAHGDELERLEADKQDKVDERLDGLGGNDVVGAIIATKQAAENAQDNAGQALITAQDAALVAGQASDTAEAIDGKATQAQQDAADALEQVVGKYTKPETGIPATDLAAAVQTSLGKADTALQAETDPTVPSWAKEATKPEYTAAEIGLGSVENITNAERIAGLLYAPSYDPETHTLTLQIKGNPTPFIVDLPLEALIANISLNEDNELVIEFEDGTEAEVPLSALLVGVAKAVNGKTADSNGAISLAIADMPGLSDELAGKVDKVAGKGLSENDYTTDEKDKLTGIATGAQVNVKSDWNAASGDAEILNKPTIPSAYTLPTASDTVKGGIKVGAGLEMDGEVLSATGGSGCTNICVEVLGNWS